MNYLSRIFSMLSYMFYNKKGKDASSISLLDCYNFLMKKGFLFIVEELGAY